MCEIFSGHIITDKEHKDWGKVIYLSGIHHEKDREKIHKEYGKDIKLAAWQTKKYASFKNRFEITTSVGDIAEKEKKELLSLLDKWKDSQNAEELFLKLVSITQGGVPLARDKFTLDLENLIIATEENNLVFDFSEVKGFTFNTGPGCTFKTGYDCTFNTGSGCTFKTGYDCTFNTGYDCTFNTGSGCTFNTGSGCVCVRRDVYEVIEIPENKKIKLNGPGVKGYKEIK